MFSTYCFISSVFTINCCLIESVVKWRYEGDNPTNKQNYRKRGLLIAYTIRSREVITTFDNKLNLLGTPQADCYYVMGGFFVACCLGINMFKDLLF
jgi:hypothetical protein